MHRRPLLDMESQNRSGACPFAPTPIVSPTPGRPSSTPTFSPHTQTHWVIKPCHCRFCRIRAPPPTRTWFWEVVHLAESRQNASPYTNHIPERVDWCMRLLTACRVKGQSLLLCISRVPEPRARYSQVPKNRHGPRRTVDNCPSYPSTPQTLLSPAEILHRTCLKRGASSRLMWATRPPS